MSREKTLSKDNFNKYLWFINLVLIISYSVWFMNLIFLKYTINNIWVRTILIGSGVSVIINIFKYFQSKGDIDISSLLWRALIYSIYYLFILKLLNYFFLKNEVLDYILISLTFVVSERVNIYIKEKYFRRSRINHYLLQNLSLLFVLSFSFYILWNYLKFLNNFLILFIKLGSFLLILNTYFLCKQLIKVFEIIKTNYYERYIWFRYMIFFICALILSFLFLHISSLENTNKNSPKQIINLSKFNPFYLNGSNISKLFKDKITKDKPYTLENITKNNINYFYANIPLLERKVHNLVNSEREKFGLSKLSWSPKINLVARKHSEDMVKRNYFEHESPEGHDFSWRYLQAGIYCNIQVGNYIYEGGENIFQGWTYKRIWYKNGIEISKDWYTIDEIAKIIVESWMNSSGHRKNILTPYWRSEGIGIAISKEGKVLVTQDFC